MRVFITHITRVLFFGLITSGVLYLSGCTRTLNPDIERGASYKYQRGFPEVLLSAMGIWDEQDHPSIDIVAEIVYGSLFYKRRGEKRAADLAILIEIYDIDREESKVVSHHFPYTIEVSDPQMTHSQDVYTMRRRVKINPGEYRIEFTVADQHSNRRITRVSNAHIPTTTRRSVITDVRLLGRLRDTTESVSRWNPITTYDVPARYDSVKVTYQVNVDTSDTLTLNSRLIEFESDSSAAKPMFHNNYSPSSLAYKGIDIFERTTIQTNRRILTQGDMVSVEFLFTDLNRGNYRFEVEADRNSGQKLYKGRDFGIKSKHYPALKSARELAAPLVYLMKEKEHDRLMAIEDPDSLKQMIDRFWLKNIRNRSDAKSVIALYYERVEEANKQFSNFKEGWKTDPGMIYILFGPPLMVRQNIKEMHWAYSYNLGDFEYNYIFLRPKLRTEFYPFHHFVLDRDHNYFNMQYRQVQLWLTGQILVKKI